MPEHQPLIPAQGDNNTHQTETLNHVLPHVAETGHPNQKRIEDPGDPQRLGVGGEAREADVELVVDLEYPLEVGGDRLQLHAEAAVAGDREAVLPHHRDHGAPVVLEDLGEQQAASSGARPLNQAWP